MRKVTPNVIITLAEAFVGYIEKATNAYLMDFERNGGNGNWTRFSQELQDAHYFDYGPKIGKEWCTQFVAWLFWMATGKDVERTKKILCVPLNEKNESAGCEGIRKYFRRAGRYDAKPKTADLIIFTTTKGSVDADHVGILKEIGKDGKLYTIEGNKDNMVCECVYPADYWKILGFCHPVYDEDSSEEAELLRVENDALIAENDKLKKKNAINEEKLRNIAEIAA